MLKILIAEDNLHERIILRNIINLISDVDIIGEATNSKEAIHLTEKHSPDVIFIDINMPDQSGIETAKKVSVLAPHIHIIFATAYENYALEAFNVYATDYIVKPYDRHRIAKTLERIKLNTLHNLNKSKLFIISKHKSVVVNFDDIILITKVGRQTVIHTVNDIIPTNENIKSLESKLSTPFFRAHRGYLINTDKVLEISPWGERTFLVKMSSTKETALMTDKNAKIFKKLYRKD